MEAPLPKRSEAVLIVDGNQDHLRQSRELIAKHLPEAIVIPVSSLAHCRELVAQQEFDVVVLDHDLSPRSAAELIHELRLKDHEPGVLVVSSSSDPRLMSDIYNSGVHKCIVKEGRWLDELGPSVRHLLRVRRLEDENRRLVSRLTEANMLLQDKNRRLDEFSATVAHDIRGPLGGVSMKLEYMIETYGKALEPRMLDLLTKAFTSTQRLTQIVQSMYSYAKLGAKAARMHEVEMAQLVEEVISDIHFSESLDIKIGIGNLPKVWGNPDLLRRLFINLLTNAVKYNNKPEIIINIGVVQLTDKNLGRFAEMYVEDNGPGIPQDELKNIFSMFARGSTAGADADGAGIGLAVVQRIAELHFGSVRVESEIGRGTKFIVSLPVEKVDFL